MIATALLGLLGVDDERIVEHYALTQRNLQGIVARLEATEVDQKMLEALPPATLHAEPDTVRRLLGRVRAEWGDLPGWARQVGLPDAARRRLESRLLESGVMRGSRLPHVAVPS